MLYTGNRNIRIYQLEYTMHMLRSSFNIGTSTAHQPFCSTYLLNHQFQGFEISANRYTTSRLDDNEYVHYKYTELPSMIHQTTN